MENPSDQPSDRPIGSDRPSEPGRPEEPGPTPEPGPPPEPHRPPEPERPPEAVRPPEPTQAPPPSGGGTGLQPNVAGALSYFLGALTGILFLVIDKDRPFVRFHAMQSILLTVAFVGLSIVLFILGVALGTLPLIGWLISVLLSLAVWIGGFVLWLYLMYRAYQGDEWQVPVLGPHARRLASQV